MKVSFALTPKDYQEKSVDSLNGTHGLILQHGLGSGKTMTSILGAERYGGAHVVVPASLRENFKKELRKTKPTGNFTIHSYESFTKHPPKDLNKRMLIVDEAHRLKNYDSKRSKALFNASRHAKKVMLLTGTPIQNDPSDMASLVNIAAGKKVLPERDKDFKARYLHEKIYTPGPIGRLFGLKGKHTFSMRHEHELRRKVHGLVSYYQPKPDLEHYPSVNHKEVDVEMHPRQTMLHQHAFNQLDPATRLAIRYSLPPGKKNLSRMNSFLNIGRQVANTTEHFDKKYKSEHSPKVNMIAKAITESKGPSIAYSNYLEGGILPLSKKLTEAGVKHHAFTGALNDAQRKAAVKDYNTGKVKALLLSSAGGEGLDLKGTRSVHIMEPHWHQAKIDQVVGRAARFDSHSHLPITDRNVNVYHYIARNSGHSSQQTADQYLKAMSDKKRRMNELFTNVMRDESVEGKPK